MIAMHLHPDDRPMRRRKGAIESGRRRLSLCDADPEHRGAKNADKARSTHVPIPPRVNADGLTPRHPRLSQQCARAEKPWIGALGRTLSCFVGREVGDREATAPI